MGKLNETTRHFTNELVPSLLEEIQELKNKLYLKEYKLFEAQSKLEIWKKQTASLTEKLKTKQQHFIESVVPLLKKGDRSQH